MRSRLMTAGIAVLGLLTLAGCGSAGSGKESAADGGRSSGKSIPGQSAGQPRDAVPGATGSAPTTAENRVTLQRAQILTADLTVRAKSAAAVSDVADKAIELVEGVGGASAGDERVQDGSRTQADVILKVPPAKYADTLDRLAKLGKELRRSAQVQDVTDEVVDVDSRVSSQTASVERIRRLLASAKNLGDVVTIEGELAKRQADLESLKARQRALGEQTADATITLHVMAPGAVATPAKKQDAGFLAGLDAGWTAFTASVTVLMMIVGALLPFLVVALLVLGPVWFVLRRRRQGSTEASGAVAAAPSA